MSDVATKLDEIRQNRIDGDNDGSLSIKYSDNEVTSWTIALDDGN